jgi:hypothetical protein
MAEPGSEFLPHKAIRAAPSSISNLSQKQEKYKLGNSLGTRDNYSWQKD